MTFNEFIFIKENSVSSLDCDRLINYFDKNTHKHRVGGLSNSINNEVKASTDIVFDEPEVIYPKKTRISCDGGEGALGHPRVWLTIPADKGYVECGYCDRKFIKEQAPAKA